MQYDVPLLPSQQTHDRMEAPNLWGYASLFFKETSEFFTVQVGDINMQFMYASVELLEAYVAAGAKFDKTLLDFMAWVRSGKCWRGRGQATQVYETLQLVGIDGQWGFGRWGASPGNQLHNYMGAPRPGFPVNRLSAFVIGKEIRDFTEGDHELINRLTTAYSNVSGYPGIKPKWKKSRAKWKRAQKKSGALAIAQAEKAADDEAELYSAKKEALAHARKHIALLAAHMEDIANDEVSVGSCRVVFDSQNDMTSINARLKKAYKLK